MSSAPASAAPSSAARCRVRETRCGWKSTRSRRPGKASRAAAIVAAISARMVGVVVDDRHPADLARPRSAGPCRRTAPSAAAASSRGDARRARAPRAPRRRSAGCARPGARAGPSKAGASRDRRAAPLAAQRSNAAVELGERAELAVMVELDVRDHRDLGREREDGAVGLVALDDEPALPRARVRCRAAAPARRSARPGRRRSRASAKAIIAAVVPFPCVPPTTIERRSATSSARNSARERPGTAG